MDTSAWRTALTFNLHRSACDWLQSDAARRNESAILSRWSAHDTEHANKPQANKDTSHMWIEKA
jgi:hypothetical protein